MDAGSCVALDVLVVCSVDESAAVGFFLCGFKSVFFFSQTRLEQLEILYRLLTVPSLWP